MQSLCAYAESETMRRNLPISISNMAGTVRKSHLCCCLLAIISGCADLHYRHTNAGRLSGRLIVEWYSPNLFIYRPDTASPLTFARRNGDVLVPSTMYTDGGSIPRELWVLRNYSPWGYGPAFVVHDWLFNVQNCHLTSYKEYSYNLADAAQVMSEVMKTLIETPGFDYGNRTSMYLMYEAVQTPIARKDWEHGKCEPVVVRGPLAKPDATFTIDFPISRP